jgi:hypothetical protein
MRAESAQEQQEQVLEQGPKLVPRQEFEALINERDGFSSRQASSTGFDPLAQAMKDNPTLTREKAEEMAAAFGF